MKRPQTDQQQQLSEDDLFVQIIDLIWYLRGDLFLFSLFMESLFFKRLKQCTEGEGVNPSWRVEIEKVSKLMSENIYSLQKELTKGDMKLDKTVYDALRKEIKQIRQIDIKEIVESISKPESLNLYVSELKDQIAKGNRANFKMMQEMIQHVEKLSSDLTDSRRQYIEQEAEALNGLIRTYTHTLLELFDLIDLIRMSVEQQGDSAWLSNLEQVVRKALAILEYHGLEEMNVDGQLFDGTIMEGIGTVSPQEINRELPKYAVYAVTQKGFRMKDTQELVRKAKVITVY